MKSKFIQASLQTGNRMYSWTRKAFMSGTSKIIVQESFHEKSFFMHIIDETQNVEYCSLWENLKWSSIDELLIYAQEFEFEDHYAYLCRFKKDDVWSYFIGKDIPTGLEVFYRGEKKYFSRFVANGKCRITKDHSDAYGYDLDIGWDVSIVELEFEAENFEKFAKFKIGDFDEEEFGEADDEYE